MRILSVYIVTVSDHVIFCDNHKSSARCAVTLSPCKQIVTNEMHAYLRTMALYR